MCYIYHGEVLLYHGEVSFLSNTDLTDLTDLCPVLEQNINQKNPLERMEDEALMSCFRLGLIRASS